MADRYWVGGTGNWSDATNHWATSSGGSPGAGNLPTTSDNVFFDSLSNATGYTVTVDAGATRNCADFSLDKPLTGTVTFAGSTAIQCNGSFTIVSATNISWTHTGTITFGATATGKTQTFNGISFGGSIVYNGVGGGWTWQDAFVCTGTSVTLTNGALNTNNNTGTLTSLVVSSNNSQSLTLGTSALTLSSSSGLSISSTNATISAASSSITLSHTSVSIDFAQNVTLGTVTVSSYTGIVTWAGSGNLSCTTLSITGGANQASTIRLGFNITVSGTLTIAGNSATNRILIASDVIGTSRTLSAGTVTLSNIDLRDITGAGAGSWNLSAITGGSGDCGGNNGITFTTAVNRYAVASGGWSATATWSTSSGGGGGASVPLPQDTAFLDANSPAGTYTTDMPRTCNIDCTGFTRTLSFNATDIYGSVTLVSGMTVAGSGAISFLGRGSRTITSGTKSFGSAITFNSVNGTYSLSDAFITTSTITLTSGTLTASNVNVSCTTFNSSNSNTRTLNMGSGTWTVTSSGTVWTTLTSTGLTLNPSSSTLSVTNGGASTITVTCNSVPINNLSVSAGTGALTLTSVVCNGNLNFTGSSRTWGNAVITVKGNITFSATLIVTSGSAVLTWGATSGIVTWNTAGVTFDRPVTIDGVGGAHILASNLTMGATRDFTLTNGTFKLDTFTLTTGRVVLDNSNTRTFDFGSGTFVATNTSSGGWDAGAGTGLTIAAGTGTIKYTASSSNNRSFTGGGKTYPNLWIADGGVGTFRIMDTNNTFNDVKIEASRSFLSTAGITTNLASITSLGSAGSLCVIGSVTAASHTLSKVGGGVIDCDFMSISRSTAAQANTFYAGTNSTDGGNNSQWIFTAPPSGVTGTAAQTLPKLAQSAAGTEVFTGTVAQTLIKLAQSASSTEQFSGTSSQTLPKLTQSATAVEVFTGTAASALPHLIQSAVGLEIITGTAAQTFIKLAQSALGTGGAGAIGTISSILPILTQTAVGVNSYTGTIVSVLPKLRQSATGIGGISTARKKKRLWVDPQRMGRAIVRTGR